jgi:hypothetical protein
MKEICMKDSDQKNVVIKLNGEDVETYKEYNQKVVKGKHYTLMGYNKEIFMRSVKEELTKIKK